MKKLMLQIAFVLMAFGIQDCRAESDPDTEVLNKYVEFLMNGSDPSSSLQGGTSNSNRNQIDQTNIEPVDFRWCVNQQGDACNCEGFWCGAICDHCHE